MSRISYRNYPILKTIKEGELKSFPYYNEDIENLRVKKEAIALLFNKQASRFRQKIIKVSHKFFENSVVCR